METTELEQLRAENASLKSQLEIISRHAKIMERESIAILIIKKIIAGNHGLLVSFNQHSAILYVMEQLAHHDRENIYYLLEHEAIIDESISDDETPF